MWVVPTNLFTKQYPVVNGSQEGVPVTLGELGMSHGGPPPVVSMLFVVSRLMSQLNSPVPVEGLPHCGSFMSTPPLTTRFCTVLVARLGGAARMIRRIRKFSTGPVLLARGSQVDVLPHSGSRTLHPPGAGV